MRREQEKPCSSCRERARRVGQRYCAQCHAEASRVNGKRRREELKRLRALVPVLEQRIRELEGK